MCQAKQHEQWVDQLLSNIPLDEAEDIMQKLDGVIDDVAGDDK